MTSVPTPDNFKDGFTVEHILLSVTIVSAKDSAGQFDDSCAHVISEELKKYHGVQSVRALVLYEHTKIENHTNGCECFHCKLTPQPQ